MDLNNSYSVIKGYYEQYNKFVRLNPRVAAEIEAVIRWSSYLVATKKSPILGELLSSGANLLQLCNDIIIRQGNHQLKLNLYSCAVQLKTYLSVVNSLELLLEIYARDTYGNIGKWAIISVIQLTKAAIKLILLFVFDEGVTKSQSIVPLDRILYSEIVKLQEKLANEIDEHEPVTPEEIDMFQPATKSLTLKSSGRKMRSITDPAPKRNSLAGVGSSENLSSMNRMQKHRLAMLLSRYKEGRSTPLTNIQKCGEVLHIARPLAHLSLMTLTGRQSWIPYLASLIMDISSLYLVRLPSQGNSIDMPVCHPQFNVNERIELAQRASSLLLYMMRSPFFDEYTKYRALDGIASASQNIPILGHFIGTFVNYIPDWQKDYFRIWSE